MIKNLKIGKKLMITFLFIAMLSSVGGIVGYSVMTNMNLKYEQALINYGFSQGDIGLFNTEFNNCGQIVRDIVNTNDSDKFIAYSSQLVQSGTKANKYFSNMKKGMVTQKELQYYNDIKENLAKFDSVKSQIISLASANQVSEAQKIVNEQAKPLSDKIRASTDALISEKTAAGNQISAALASEGNMARLTVVLIILASLIFSLLIALKIAQSISRPVREMAAAAQKMAEGDLNVQVKANSGDEIGQLSAAFAESVASIRLYIADITRILGEIKQGNLTVTSELEYAGDYAELKNSCEGILSFLNDTLGEINQAAEEVSSGSRQVSNTAQALAQGAAEQASSIEELSASITEISSHIRKNAEHAASANENGKRAGSEIEIGNKHMSEMVAAMSQISDSSSQIGKIIKTIEDIAFQTNILALNAAVEAARAGAAGKGFAVVADEVRNLAGKSAEAAKDTTSLIENAITQVENGTKIASETADSLLQVVESTKAITGTVDRISEASGRQADAVGQITRGVDQISDVVQRNSATAEESAAASEELSGQASRLKMLVQKFRLKSNTDEIQVAEPVILEESGQDL